VQLLRSVVGAHVILSYFLQIFRSAGAFKKQLKQLVILEPSIFSWRYM